MHAPPPHPVGPPLYVTTLVPLVQPGAVHHIVISYIKDALVQARVSFPGYQPFSLVNATDSHGRLTFSVQVPHAITLRDGHATGSVVVSAIAGPSRPLTHVSAVVRAHTIAHITVSTLRDTLVQATVTFPYRPVASGSPAPARPRSAIRVYGLTDTQGRLPIAVPVPADANVVKGQTVASITVSTVLNTYQAQTARIVHISDMVVGIDAGPIVRCTQQQTIRVAYQPYTPLRIVLAFPSHRLPAYLQRSLIVRTDKHGAVVVRVRLTYVTTLSPVDIRVRAFDIRAHANRTEGTSISVRLPQACSVTAPIHRR